MSESKNKIEVINLTKKFGDLLVLDDISFSIKKGEFVCVVGPTGCGKTTFLNLLCFLVPMADCRAEHIVRIGYQEEERGGKEEER